MTHRIRTLKQRGKGQGARKVRSSVRLRRIGVRDKSLSFFSCRLSLVLFSLLLLAGCVSTTDYDAMRSDINQLKRDAYELKKESAEVRKTVSTIKEHASGTVKEESFSAIRESQSSLYTQVSDMSKDLQILRGRFDESKFFIDKSLKDNVTERELLRSQINSLETRIKELNERIPKLSESRPSVPPQKPLSEGETPAVTEKPAEQKKPDDDPAKAYEAAYNTLKEKKYKDARGKFSAFLKRFPKDGLAGNAQFWIAETYYAEKDFESAILSYETVIKDYPHSEKIPGALLKQALAFMEIGDKKTAKVIFEKLIEKYPASKETETAKKKKAEIEKSAKKTGKR